MSDQMYAVLTLYEVSFGLVVDGVKINTCCLLSGYHSFVDRKLKYSNCNSHFNLYVLSTRKWIQNQTKAITVSTNHLCLKNLQQYGNRKYHFQTCHMNFNINFRFHFLKQHFIFILFNSLFQKELITHSEISSSKQPKGKVVMQPHQQPKIL